MSNKNLCDRFYKIFPDMGCSNFVVFVPASAFGEPHITTLDGVTYPLNVWGEYILMEIKSQNFMLQCRTRRIEGVNGTLSNATVFIAFAAKEGDYAKFQVELATNNIS
ncbi:unnamed protein product [Lymnaea stagnalis]|uniref:VWFD domain-containing protein n=1 Tax=Lymnaea stagnalis TaxID=6523 RepID=A0AAV2IQ96_LYMST